MKWLVQALLLGAFCFVSSGSALAQFVPGYVITHQSDTIKGFIEDRNDRWNKKSIVFKKELSDSEVVRYSVLSIKGFGITEYGDDYISKIVKVDQKPLKTYELESNGDPKFIMDSVFLKRLVMGKANLYTYSDANRQHFYLEQGSSIEELSILKYLMASRIVEVELYKQNLKNLLIDCEKMRNKTASFSEKSLTQFIREYNECVSGIKYADEVKKKTIIVPEVFIGASSNSMKYDGADKSKYDLDASEFNYSSTVNPIVGVSVDFMSARKTNPLSANMELFWKTAGKYSIHDVRPMGGTIYKKEDAVFQFNYLNYDVSIKYAFLKQKKVNPYLRLGIAYSVLIKYKSDYTAVMVDDAVRSGSLAKFRNGFGGIGALGIKAGKFYGEVRYQFINFATDVQGSVYIKSADFVVGYRLINK